MTKSNKIEKFIFCVICPLNMSSSGTENDSSSSSDVDFDDYGSSVTNLNQNIRKKNSDKWKR